MICNVVQCWSIRLSNLSSIPPCLLTSDGFQELNEKPKIGILCILITKINFYLFLCQRSFIKISYECHFRTIAQNVGSLEICQTSLKYVTKHRKVRFGQNLWMRPWAMPRTHPKLCHENALNDQAEISHTICVVNSQDSIDKNRGCLFVHLTFYFFTN